MILQLAKKYTSRDGTPVISRVDPGIFVKQYFTYCMQCTFCHDICCSYGADVDVENVKRLEAYTDELEAYTHVPRAEWFTERYEEDSECSGGGRTRTKVQAGACVFLNRRERGCMIHSFCLENGLDYHTLKPIVCWLFPITFDNGLMSPSNELEEGSLICMNQGPTLYKAARSELQYYFGDDLVSELDGLETLTS